MATTLNPEPRTSRKPGTPPDRFDLDAPAGGSVRSQWPELTLGLIVVGVFALAGAWFYSNASEADQVLALGGPVERGAVITRSDLVIVDIATQDLVNTLTNDQSTLVVGNIALTDLSAGTLITSDLFISRAPIPPGDGIVGLALAPGQFPTLSLRPGDAVRVVATPRQGDDTANQSLLVDAAEVVDVQPIGVQGQLFISLLMTTDETDLVSSAASQDRVRLIQVGGN